MDGERLAFAGMAAQARMVRAGETTPGELVEMYLGRIRRLEPRLNAFRIVDADGARAAAADVERRLAAGESLPLAGVPIALKDTDDVAGEVSRWGSDAYDRPATADQGSVRRLRAAGAVVVGRTNLPELAIFPFTESAATGVTRNPWEVGHSPGGSSGGSAAAVAAGLVAAASASDGGGSIRIPAALCGLVGLKPQRDRIPLTPYAEHWTGLTVTGCVTRTVADTALWLDVCGDPDDDGGTFVDAAATDPAPLRIAWSVAAPRAAAPPIVSEVVTAAVTGTAALLTALGHTVVARDPEWGGVGNNVVARYLGGIAAQHVEHPARLEPRTAGVRRMGRAIPAGMVRRARTTGADADTRRIGALFDDVDVLVTPVTGVHALAVERWAGRGAVRTVLDVSRAFPFAIPWNHLGFPAVSVPAGIAADGLPVGVQLVGPARSEARLLALAGQLERARPWADVRPPGF